MWTGGRGLKACSWQHSVLSWQSNQKSALGSASWAGVPWDAISPSVREWGSKAGRLWPWYFGWFLVLTHTQKRLWSSSPSSCAHT